MGLDTTHDCRHGAYSSFFEWRTAITKAADLPLEAGFRHGETYVCPEGEGASRNFEGWWDEWPTEILDVLLRHSDCDGWIFPQHCEPLADRLQGLLPKLEGYDKERAEQFIAGLRRAADEYQIVEYH